MEIMQLQLKDYEEIYELWMNTPGMGLNNVDDSQAGFERFLRRNPTTCFVARQNEKAVGVILCGHDGRRGYIYHLAVRKNNRRQGIATALVASATEALRSESIHKVALVVFSKNEDGNAFWEQAGFEERRDLTYRNKALATIERIDVE